MFQVGDFVVLVDMPAYDYDDEHLIGMVSKIENIGKFEDWRGSACQYEISVTRDIENGNSLLVRDWQIRKLDPKNQHLFKYIHHMIETLYDV